MKILNIINTLISKESINKIKEILLILFDLLYLNTIFRFITKPSLTILLYHGIKNNDNFWDRYQVPKSLFLKQLKYLKKKKYKFITISEWIALVLAKTQIKHNYVILTFDDGYKNVLTNGYPLMVKYQAKGCIYVVPEFVGKENLERGSFIMLFLENLNKSIFYLKFKDKIIEYTLSSMEDIILVYKDIREKLMSLDYNEKVTHFNQFKDTKTLGDLGNMYRDYLLADWEELEGIDNKILEIGSHTLTHYYLTSVTSPKKYQQELLKSKEKIEKKLKMTVNHLSYPNGAYNDMVLKLAKKYEYTTGVTIDYGFNDGDTDFFKLKRVFAHNNFPLFKASLSGLYVYLKKTIFKFA